MKRSEVMRKDRLKMSREKLRLREVEFSGKNDDGVNLIPGF